MTDISHTPLSRIISERKRSVSLATDIDFLDVPTTKKTSIINLVKKKIQRQFGHSDIRKTQSTTALLPTRRFRVIQQSNNEHNNSGSNYDSTVSSTDDLVFDGLDEALDDDDYQTTIINRRSEVFQQQKLQQSSKPTPTRIQSLDSDLKLDGEDTDGWRSPFKSASPDIKISKKGILGSAKRTINNVDEFVQMGKEVLQHIDKGSVTPITTCAHDTLLRLQSATEAIMLLTGCDSSTDNNNNTITATLAQMQTLMATNSTTFCEKITQMTESVANLQASSNETLKLAQTDMKATSQQLQFLLLCISFSVITVGFAVSTNLIPKESHPFVSLLLPILFLLFMTLILLRLYQLLRQ